LKLACQNNNRSFRIRNHQIKYTAIKRNIGWAFAGLFMVVSLIFLPLILSGIEHFLLGSHKVEDGLRRLGIHDDLDKIYEPIPNVCGL
jgi:hypothetical protein